MQSWDQRTKHNRKPASEDRKKQGVLIRVNNQINVVRTPVARLPVYINA